MLKNLFLVFALALLWAVSGLFMGMAINALFDTAWLVPCTALNVIAGMLMLLLTTRHERVRRIFYEGPRQEEPGVLALALLWAFPFILIFLGILWWLLAQFLK